MPASKKQNADPTSAAFATVAPNAIGDLALAAWLATKLHGNQVRKGTAVPYISHLYGVSAIVMEFGGDEEQSIAALLHDAIEDAGEEPARETIRRMFGPGVEEIVVACTDTDETPKPPWEQRKREHLAHLRDADARVLLVAAADKLHNARCTLEDVRREGLEVYKRFNAPRGAEDTLWYYSKLASIFIQRDIGPTARTFSDTASELERVTRDRELFPA